MSVTDEVANIIARHMDLFHVEGRPPAGAQSAAAAVLAFLQAEWRTIDSAPKDGTIVDLTWMEGGEPAEIWAMQWAHIQRNGLFPGTVGMWTAPDGSVTWNGDNEGGPTHWRRHKRPGLDELLAGHDPATNHGEMDW